MVLLKTTDLLRDFQIKDRIIHVLKGINVEINQGDFVILLGASGAGKSTFLNILAGFDKPTSGQYFFEGHDMTSLNFDQLAVWRQENLGMVFQSFNLIPFMNAIDNVALPLVFSAISLKKRMRKAKNLLVDFGLKDRMDHTASQLSGGEQQRVAVARALINNPPFLIADEPTGNLDSVTAEEIIGMLYYLNKEKHMTILMATHNTSYAKYANKILHLLDGKITDQEINKYQTKLDGLVGHIQEKYFKNLSTEKVNESN